MSEKKIRINGKKIKLKKNDQIYLFSDGAYDQLGGPNDKRFSYKKLNEIFKKYSHEPMDVQKAALCEELSQWRGKCDQTDDITVLGFKI